MDSQENVIMADTNEVEGTVANVNQELNDDLALDHDGMNHIEVMKTVQDVLRNIITTDPLLCDLPPEATLEEINSQIALEHGQAMMVFVRRADGQVMPIVVTQTATVLDLKHAIKRYMSLKLTREGRKIGLSWKYIWKRYWLHFEGQKLTENNKPLKEYSIKNKDEVTFIRRLNER
ncbi:hypothetical protein ScPMuIL_008073 [Solemya velum]